MNLFRTAALALMVVPAASALASGRLIAVDSNRSFFELNMTTGAKTQLGTVSANAGTTGGLAYDRANDVLYLTSTSEDALYKLDLTTGQATLVGSYGINVVMHGL